MTNTEIWVYALTWGMLIGTVAIDLLGRHYGVKAARLAGLNDASFFWRVTQERVVDCIAEEFEARARDFGSPAIERVGNIARHAAQDALIRLCALYIQEIAEHQERPAGFREALEALEEDV